MGVSAGTSHTVGTRIRAVTAARRCISVGTSKAHDFAENAAASVAAGLNTVAAHAGHRWVALIAGCTSRSQDQRASPPETVIERPSVPQ
jgi:hypothetical protein